MKYYELRINSPLWEQEKIELYDTREAAEQAQMYYFMNGCQTKLT